MARLNVPTAVARQKTHEGANAKSISLEKQLRRSVMACLLWEDSFYEDGESIAERISKLIKKVPPETVAKIAIEAREKMKLRHIPLFLCSELAKLHNADSQQKRSQQKNGIVSATIERVIQRADEIPELLAIYNKGREGEKIRFTHQMRKGLARAFTKFSEYDLAKYDRDGAIKLRDALFLVHPKHRLKKNGVLFAKLANKDHLPAKTLSSGFLVAKTYPRLAKSFEGLETPDTWEVALSGSQGEGKKAIWERLLKEEKLGALALLRNLRNMKEAGVKESLVKSALEDIKVERVLPFRFISAAKYAPQWEPQLEKAMFKCIGAYDKLPGKIAIIIDNSGSMYSDKLSAKSELLRSDAACALAILVRELFEDPVIIAFSEKSVIVPPRRGFALRDAIFAATEHGSTMTDNAMALAQQQGYERVILITDEQSHQVVRNPQYNGMHKTGYLINVASYKNGIGYGPWVHIDGWSEAVVEFIREYEGDLD